MIFYTCTDILLLLNVAFCIFVVGSYLLVVLAGILHRVTTIVIFCHLSKDCVLLQLSVGNFYCVIKLSFKLVMMECTTPYAD